MSSECELNDNNEEEKSETGLGGEFLEENEETLLQKEIIEDVEAVGETKGVNEANEAEEEPISKGLQAVIEQKGGVPRDWSMEFSGGGYSFDGKEVLDPDGNIWKNDEELHQEMLTQWAEGGNAVFFLPDHKELTEDCEIHRVTVMILGNNGEVTFETYKREELLQKPESQQAYPESTSSDMSVETHGEQQESNTAFANTDNLVGLEAKAQWVESNDVPTTDKISQATKTPEFTICEQKQLKPKQEEVSGDLLTEVLGFNESGKLSSEFSNAQPDITPAEQETESMQVEPTATPTVGSEENIPSSLDTTQHEVREDAKLTEAPNEEATQEKEAISPLPTDSHQEKLHDTTQELITSKADQQQEHESHRDTTTEESKTTPKVETAEPKPEGKSNEDPSPKIESADTVTDSTVNQKTESNQNETPVEQTAGVKVNNAENANDTTQENAPATTEMEDTNVTEKDAPVASDTLQNSGKTHEQTVDTDTIDTKKADIEIAQQAHIVEANPSKTVQDILRAHGLRFDTQNTMEFKKSISGTKDYSTTVIPLHDNDNNKSTNLVSKFSVKKRDGITMQMAA